MSQRRPPITPKIDFKRRPDGSLSLTVTIGSVTETKVLTAEEAKALLSFNSPEAK